MVNELFQNQCHMHLIYSSSPPATQTTALCTAIDGNLILCKLMTESLTIGSKVGKSYCTPLLGRPILAQITAPLRLLSPEGEEKEDVEKDYHANKFV